MEKKEQQYFDLLKAKLEESRSYLPVYDLLITQAAETLYQIDIARKALDEKGQVQKFKNDVRQISPELIVWRRLRQDFAKYCDQLGFSPKARKAIGLELRETVFKENPFRLKKAE